MGGEAVQSRSPRALDVGSIAAHSHTDNPGTSARDPPWSAREALTSGAGGAVPRFVPCRVGHLVQELSEWVEPELRPQWWELAHQVENLYHHRASVRARLLGALYAPFDPDSDTVPAASAREESLGRLEVRLGELLEAANFEVVPQDALVTARDREVLARLQLDPDPDALERVGVWARGRGTKALRLRPIRRMFRLQEVEVPTWRRVVVAVRTRDDPHVTLKMFKDVPLHDLELLLPTVRVKMKLFDKLKLSGSGSAAAISAWKLLRLAYTYTPGLAKLLALPFQALLLPAALLVGGVYGGKTILDYSKIRASYVTVLAEHLYAITVASNQSVISRVAEMAGEEDTKELLIAYALLLRLGRTGADPQALRGEAESFLWDRYRAQVRFDVEDALHKLEDLALVWRSPAGGQGVIPVPAALRNLDRSWDELYSAPA